MTEPIQTKICTKCKEIKPHSDFYKDKRRSTGVRACCRTCSQLLQQNYRATPDGKATTRAWRQTPEGCQQMVAITHKMRKKYPERYQGRNAVRSAILTGKMPYARTQLCKDCGKQAELWHHYLGYAPEHWLDVIPLCRLCDRKAHREAPAVGC